MELFLGGLALLFIALKLLNKVTWSWLTVLAPIWFPFGLAVGVGLLLGVSA